MASVELYSETVPQVLPFPEHATHGTFSPGDLVQIDTNGKVQIATAGSMTGIAKTKYTGTTDTAINVELIDPNAIYSARNQATATAQTLVGDCLDFVFTAGAHTLASGGTTDVYCVGLDPRDALGTSGGRLLFRFYGTLLTADAT